MRAGIQGLEEAGYITRTQSRDENGMFTKNIYNVFEIPTVPTKPTAATDKGTDTKPDTAVETPLCDFPITDISKLWYDNTGTPYVATYHYIYEDDKPLILDYAESVNDLDKVKALINKLGSISDGVYDYDDIIAQAKNEVNTIRSLDDFDFSDDNTKNTISHEKPNINSLLSFKPNQ